MGKKKKTSVPIEPCDDWVVVVAREPGEMTAGGIFIPKDSREDIQETLYEVVAVGPGREIVEIGPDHPKGKRVRRPVKVKVGDVVLMRKTLAVRCAFQDVIYWVAQDQDVVAKVKKGL